MFRLLRRIALITSLTTACTPAQQRGWVRAIDEAMKQENGGRTSGKAEDNRKKKPATQAGNGRKFRVWEGESIWLPPPTGFTDAWLGVPFDGALRPIGAIPVKAPRTTDEKQETYTFDYDEVDDTLQQSLTISVLGLGGASAEMTSDTRILRYHALCVSEERSLQGDPQVSVPGDYAIVPFRVRYGWSYDQVFWGAKETVARRAEAMFQAFKGGLAQKLVKMKVREKHWLRGLEPRGGDLPLAHSEEDVKRLFKRSNKAAPIAVEFKVVGKAHADKLLWSEYRLREGVYAVRLHVELPPTGPSGGSWEPRGFGRPEIDASLAINGKPVGLCHVTDSFILDCNQTIKIARADKNVLKVSLGDFGSRKIYGEFVLPHDSLVPFKEIAIPTGASGITRVLVQFEPAG